MKKWLTSAEAAEYLGMHRNSVSRIITRLESCGSTDVRRSRQNKRQISRKYLQKEYLSEGGRKYGWKQNQTALIAFRMNVGLRKKLERAAQNEKYRGNRSQFIRDAIIAAL